MKKGILSALAFFVVFSVKAQTISQVRNLGIGQTVTVTGVATRSYVNNNAWLHKTSQNSTVPTGTFVFGDLDDAG